MTRSAATTGARRRANAQTLPLTLCQTRRLTACLLVALAACNGDRTVAPDQARPIAVEGALAASGSSIAALPACTLHWRNGVSGNFNDAARWNPSVVPGPNDVACLDAAGTYTVTLAVTETVDAIKVGNGTATVTLASPATHPVLNLTSGLVVRKTSSLIGTPCGIDILAGSGSNLLIDGTFTAANLSCAGLSRTIIVADTIANTGTMTLSSCSDATVANGGLFKNTGTLVVDSTTILHTANHPLVNLAGGSISGAGSLEVKPQTATRTDLARVEWNGGTLPPTAAFHLPLARVRADTFVFGSPSLTGDIMLDKQPAETTLVRGNIGQNVALLAYGCDQSQYRFERVSGAPTRNDGKVTIDANSPNCLAASTNVTGPGMINGGTFTVTAHQAHTVTLQFDSLVNNNSIVLNTVASAGRSGQLLRNVGSVQAVGAAKLTMDPGSLFIAEPGSTQTGQLVLSSAQLYGSGTVGTVTSNGGSIYPGAQSGTTVATLTAASVVLDATSRLTIDVAGAAAGAHDVLAVTGSVTYGGTLTITPVAPFVGGVCGDVVPIITDNSFGARSSFNNFSGFQPSAIANWRSFNPAHEFDIVAYNPSITVEVVASPIAVVEGGAVVSYPACLSRAPVAAVTLTPTSVLGQLTFSPTAAIFPLVGWEPPQRITLSAIDDATVEPALTDVVTHQVTSADPTFNGAPTTSLSVTVGDNDGNADLALTITSGPSTVPLGAQLTVSFDVTNNGPTLSTGATFNIPVVAGFSYVSSTSVSCTVQATTGVTCTIPGVASGAKVSFSIIAKAKVIGAWPVTMTVRGQQPDPNATNDFKVKTVTVS